MWLIFVAAQVAVIICLGYEKALINHRVHRMTPWYTENDRGIILMFVFFELFFCMVFFGLYVVNECVAALLANMI